MKLAEFLDTYKNGDDGALVNYLENCFKMADLVRRKFEPDWFANIQYLAGNQWEAYTSDIQRFARVDLKSRDTKTKITVNRILPLVRQSMANVLGSMNKIDAVPNTNQQADIDAANIATDVLDWRWEEDEEKEKTNHELPWVMTCGRTFRKTYWDPNAGREGLKGPGGEGDIVSVSVNPFRVWPCPWVESADWPIPWLIEADCQDIDAIEFEYGKKVKGESIDNARNQLDRLLVSVVDGGTTVSNQGLDPNSSSSETAQRKNSANVKKMFITPSNEQPKGRLLVWAGNTLLDDRELPSGIMPYVPRDCFYVPGRQWPLPMVSALRPLQREYNVTLSMIIELKNRQLRGDIITDSMAGVQMKADPATGRRTYIISQGQRWESVMYDARVQEAEITLQRCVDDMREIAGIHEPTMGKTGARATTATQVNILKESDQMGMTLQRENIDISSAKIAKQKLILASDNYKNMRVAKILGLDDTTRITEFMGSDLRKTYDVKIRTTAMMSQSVQAQMRLEATTQGLFGPYASMEDELAKRRALINMRIPGVEDEMRDAMPIEELQKMVNVIRQLKGQLEINGLEAQKISMDAQLEQLLAPPATPVGVPGTDQGVTPELNGQEQAMRQQAASMPTPMPQPTEVQ